MKISVEQVDYVKRSISSKGVYSAELLDELTDHICSMIETRGSVNSDFFEVYKLVVDEFNPSNFSLIQELIVNNKKSNNMKTVKLILACLAAYATFVMLISLFPAFTNASVNALRMTGFIVYATGVLILAFFLIRFKMKDNNLRLIISFFGYFASFILVGFGMKEINVGMGNSMLKIIPYLFMVIVSFSGIFFYLFRKNVNG